MRHSDRQDRSRRRPLRSPLDNLLLRATLRRYRQAIWVADHRPDRIAEEITSEAGCRIGTLLETLVRSGRIH